MLLSVVIPCYNEIKTLDFLLNKVREVELPSEWEKEIIVVDDGSTDGSQKYLRNVDVSIKVILRYQNGGKGAALKDGFKLCSGDYIIIQDADLECDPGDFPKLLKPILTGEANIVFGIRKYPENVNLLKSLNFFGGILLTKFYNILFSRKLTDMACCYKLFPKKYIAEVIELPFNDFRYDVVYLTHFLASVAKPAEVPVSYFLRTKKEGKKMNFKVGLLCFKEILKLRFS